jgi:hypothetical protein
MERIISRLVEGLTILADRRTVLSSVEVMPVPSGLNFLGV